MMARRFAILRPHPTVGTARSRCDAVQRPLSAGSRAASMKRHAMSPALWPRLKRSNNRAAKESALKCCSPISSASSSLVAFGFVARAAHRTSSRSRLSRRTYAGSPNWSLDHHRWPRLVLRKRCGRQCPCSKGPAAKRSGRNRWLQDIEKITSLFPSPTFATKSAHSRHFRSLAYGIVTFCLLEFLYVLRRQLGLIERERDFAELAGEGERYLIVGIVDRRAGVRTDIKTFIPL